MVDNENEINKESHRRALALEAAMMLLIDGLAARGTISADEAEDMLQILSKSSHLSAARAAGSIRIVNQLRQLRGGDGLATPGA